MFCSYCVLGSQIHSPPLKTERPLHLYFYGFIHDLMAVDFIVASSLPQNTQLNDICN